MEVMRCLIVGICYNKLYEIQGLESCSILHEILLSVLRQDILGSRRYLVDRVFCVYSWN